MTVDGGYDAPEVGYLLSQVGSSTRQGMRWDRSGAHDCSTWA